MLRHAARHGRGVEVVSAVVYGIVLEEGDMLVFRSYAYSDQFLLRVLDVPVVIALCWAMILYTTMHLSDALNLPEATRPFFDAVQGIVMDLSFDAVAIRAGLWHWVIPLDKAWFGVPAGNFYGWLMVVFIFSALTRWLRRRPWDRRRRAVLQAASPALAYPLMLASVVPFLGAERLFYGRAASDGEGLPVFAGAMLLFVLVSAFGFARRGASLEAADGEPVLLAPRLLMHLFFLAVLVGFGIFQQWPALLAVSLAMLLLELHFHATRHGGPLGLAADTLREALPPRRDRV